MRDGHVAGDVRRRAQSSDQPVHGKKQGRGFERKSRCRQNERKRDESRFGNARDSDRGHD